MTMRVSRWQEVLNRHRPELDTWEIQRGAQRYCLHCSKPYPCLDRVLALAGVAADEQTTKHLQAIRDALRDAEYRPPDGIEEHAVAALALLEPPHDKEHA